MRLLHTGTLQLTEFIGRERPHYAILSHTWGDEEILSQDVQGGHGSLMTSNKAGLDKVLKAASVARRNGFDYIWIDTCCIDKSSSAELSEAINSMFAWYNQARVCYAYIADFDSTKANAPSATNRWFTRGWTLQELIAPRRVDFYDSNWIRFGDRASLAKSLSAITGIDELALGWHLELECPVRLEMAIAARAAGQHSIPGRIPCKCCCEDVVGMLESFSVAIRMSWAANRTTTREEDTAYSLLGMFGVNIPLLYGEGLDAFLRLQREIVRKYHDHSVFAWPRCWENNRPTSDPSLSTRLLAKEPSWFSGCSEFHVDNIKRLGPVTPT